MARSTAGSSSATDHPAAASSRQVFVAEAQLSSSTNNFDVKDNHPKPQRSNSMKYVAPGQAGSIVTVAPRYENFIGGKWLAPTQGTVSYTHLTLPTNREV